MAATMPLVKINENLRINLFNVASVTREQHQETAGGEREDAVVIRYNGGSNSVLHGEEAADFLEYFDSLCDKLEDYRPSSVAAPAEDPGETTTGRDFGALVAEDPPPPSDG